MRYATARRDFEYLETIAELQDQVDLDSQREELMRDPTKAKAGDMYEQGVGLWFQEHKSTYADDRRVRRIAERHGFDLQ